MGTTTTLVTVQEFLALPESQEERRELIGGEIVSISHGGRPQEFVKSNIVSSESASQLSRKVGLYLSNGGKSVWAVFPDEQKVWIYTAGQAKEFQSSQMLEDPSLPGFRAPVSDIFEGI